jgi:hypothetical protein
VLRAPAVRRRWRLILSFRAPNFVLVRLRSIIQVLAFFLVHLICPGVPARASACLYSFVLLYLHAIYVRCNRPRAEPRRIGALIGHRVLGLRFGFRRRVPFTVSADGLDGWVGWDDAVFRCAVYPRSPGRSS